jgi:hypothetical protein
MLALVPRRSAESLTRSLRVSQDEEADSVDVVKRLSKRRDDKGPSKNEDGSASVQSLAHENT